MELCLNRMVSREINKYFQKVGIICTDEAILGIYLFRNVVVRASDRPDIPVCEPRH
jgi:hypothetical protein